MSRISRLGSPLVLLLGLVCASCTRAPIAADRSSVIYDEKGGQMTLQEEISSPLNTDEKIELLWVKPKIDAPSPEGYPALILVHAHQEPGRPGAKEWAKLGMLAQFANQGILTAAVSLPGYGSSTGPSDFAGERSVQAVRAAISFIKSNGARAGKIAIWGMGKGGTVAALAAADNPDVCGVAMVSAILNPSLVLSRLKAKGDSLSAKNAHEMELEGVQEQLSESGSASVLARAPSIHAPIFYLGGATDEWIDSDQALELTKIVTASGGWTSTKVFSEYGSYIPYDLRNQLVFPFIAKVLK